MTTQVVIVHTGGNHLADVLTMTKIPNTPDRETRRRTIGTGQSVNEYVHDTQYVMVVEHDDKAPVT
jgi:hypothetical protein